MYEDLSVFNIFGSDICRADIQNATRSFPGNDFSILYIVESHKLTSKIKRQNIFSFSLQKSQHESVTVLLYTYIAYLVSTNPTFRRVNITPGITKHTDEGYFSEEYCRAHWGMGLTFHQAKSRWTRREEDSNSSVLDLCLGLRS